MARKFRKSMAVALSLSLCASSLAMPTMAANASGVVDDSAINESSYTETTLGDAGETTTITTTDSDWDVTITESDDSSVGTDTDTDNTTDDAGTDTDTDDAADTAGSDTDTDDAADAAGSDTDTDDAADAAGTDTDTDDAADAAGSDTDTDDAADAAGTDTDTGDADTTSDGTTTTVTGQETEIDVLVTDGEGRVTEKSNSVSGSENTTQTVVETEMTTTEDVLQSETTTTTTIVNGEITSVVTDGEITSTGEAGANTPIQSQETPGEWEDIEGSELPGSWVPGDVEDEDWQKDGETEQPAENNPAPKNTDIDLGNKDPLEGDGTITIDLKPGDNNKKIASETVTISLDELVEQNVTVDDLAKQVKTGTEDVLEGDKKIGTKTTEVDIVEKRDDAGNLIGYEVITTVTTIKETGEESEPVADDPVNSEPSDAAPADAQPLPEDVKAGVEDILDNDGKKIGTVETQIEEVVDASTGKKVWKVTKITTTDAAQTDTAASDAAYADETPADVVAFTLPEKPQGGETTDEATGEKTVVTVEDIYEDGKLVGYKSVTKVLDKDGNELSSSADSIYGTETTVQSKTETTASDKVSTTTTNTVVTETFYYSATEETRNVSITSTKAVEMEKTVEVTTQGQIVEINGQEYAFYGSMSVVDASKTESTGDEGLTGTIGLDKFVVETALNGKGNLLIPPGAQAVTGSNDLQNDATINSSWYTPYSKDELSALQGKLSDGEYVLIGFGLYSEYNVYDDQNVVHAPRQYAVLSNQGISYGYCVELNKAVVRPDGKNLGNNDNNDANNSTKKDKYVYEQLDLDAMLGQQIKVPLKNGKDALAPLNSIVTNGYWGTSSGSGSLEAVKELLKNSSDPAAIAAAETLTEGQALAATQIAIWKYGRNETNGSYNSFGDVLTQYYSDANPYGSTHHKEGSAETLSQDYDNIKALYDVLTKIAAEKEGAPSIPTEISANTVKDAAIVLKEEVPVEQYGSVSEAVKQAKGNNDKVYDTDVSFTLAITNSTYNGDLLVYVYAGNDTTNPVATRRIAGTGNEMGFGANDIRVNGGNTTYTIRDIKLAENVSITLNLKGTQNLADGVFVYQCDDSQNFIGGLTSKEQNVDLSVNLSFRVEEPSAQMTETNAQTVDTYTAVRTDTKVDTHEEKKIDEHRSGNSRTEITETVNTKLYADVTVTEVTVDETESSRAWSSSWKELYTYNDNTGGDNTGGGNNGGDNTGGGNTGGGGNNGGGEELQELPEEETPLAELPEEEVPLAELPEEEVPLTELPEEEVPLTELPEEEVPLEELPEEEIPLAEIPQTGDSSLLWQVLSLLSGGGLAGLKLLKKREKEI